MAVVFFSVLGWRIHHHGYVEGKAEIKAEWDAQTLQSILLAGKVKSEEQAAADLIARDTSEILDNLKKSNVELQKRLEDEISKNDVYKRCIVPASGVMLYNQAASPDHR